MQCRCCVSCFIVNLFFSGFVSVDTSLKKNDNEILGSKDWRAYMATMAVDFLVLVLPNILFFTVSVCFYL